MKILIVEDEFSLADAIAETLKREKFEVNIITDGEEGEYEATSGVYDLILLDVMLPKKNGFEILKTIKEEKVDVPVIMLTAKSELEDKLNGLENGADDYITKPFHMKELVARIKTVLKRTAKVEDTNYLEYGDLKLDKKNGQLISKENSVSISGKELNLIEILLINKNQVVSREQLASKIWGYDSDAEYNNVEVYMSLLRRKLNALRTNIKIKAIRGIGYRLEGEK